MYKKILNDASRKSYWRGYDYYKQGFVKSINKESDTIYTGIVKGSEDYHVTIDLEHPRKSTCDCPYANGKRIVCKHKVALVMSIFPEAVKEAGKIIEEEERLENEREQREYERYLKIKEDVMTWSLEQLQNYVINTILEQENSYYEEDDDFFDW